MRASMETAANMAGRSLEATIQKLIFWDPEGWERIENEENFPHFKKEMDSAFQLLGIDRANEVMYNYQNVGEGTIAPVAMFDEDYVDTGDIDEEIFYVEPIKDVTFANVINSVRGAIIADYNISPAAKGRFQFESTRIYQWSDAAFLEWMEDCEKTGTPITNLRWIFRAKVENKDTVKQVFDALDSENIDSLTVWPGKTFTLADNPDQFHAILGSKNGAGGAYLLITHKARLGVKELTSVTVWSGNADYPIGQGTDDIQFLRLFMYFSVADVANPT